MASSLTILHFNDVYRVTPQKLSGTNDTIDVTQFASLLNRSRPPSDEGLVLFSGDLFSPSLESTITRGSHMVPVMNYLKPDVALTGNHDFDFGFPHLSKLVLDSTYPWILSNIVDTGNGSNTPHPLKKFQVLKRSGISIGIIGLVEKEWIETISSWPETFQWVDMEDTALALSKMLRDPTGPFQCDIIIALTHCRLPNDIALAKAVGARPGTTDLASKHGVDLLLGGHDHMYYVSKGCHLWEQHDINQPTLGAEQDDGVLLVKSGSDFRDLSSLELCIKDMGDHCVRRRVIESIKGKRLTTDPAEDKAPELRMLLDNLLISVSNTLKSPLCLTANLFDLRSHIIRTEESAAGNWFADVLMHAYDDALLKRGYHGADGVLIAAGTLRGDSCYEPGVLTLGDVLEILPFDDPMVVLEIDGDGLWSALENALETWPAQEGRFPVISGFRVQWDSRSPPGQRIVSVSSDNFEDSDGDGLQSPPPLSHIERTKQGRMYTIVTRDYMASGHDGFKSLVNREMVIDKEAGQLFSTIVRRYLLGSQYIYTKKENNRSLTNCLHYKTKDIVTRQRRHVKGQFGESHGTHGRRSKSHYRETLDVAHREHMEEIDCFDGTAARNIGPSPLLFEPDMVERTSLMTIIPVVDGRLTDLGR